MGAEQYKFSALESEALERIEEREAEFQAKKLKCRGIAMGLIPEILRVCDGDTKVVRLVAYELDLLVNEFHHHVNIHQGRLTATEAARIKKKANRAAEPLWQKV